MISEQEIDDVRHEEKRRFKKLGRNNRNAAKTHVVRGRQNESVAFGHVFKVARIKAEREAQHGPVRVIVKDGKPVK